MDETDFEKSGLIYEECRKMTFPQSHPSKLTIQGNLKSVLTMVPLPNQR